jgi:hypothetical protein
MGINTALCLFLDICSVRRTRPVNVLEEPHVDKSGCVLVTRLRSGSSVSHDSGERGGKNREEVHFEFLFVPLRVRSMRGGMVLC